MIAELYRLIHSLTSVEKKMFVMHTKMSEGDKDYLKLYEIILQDKTNNIEEIKRAFSKKLPTKCFQNNVSYLFNFIMKVLVILRVGQDSWFNELYGLMVSRLCIERSLSNSALKILNETKEKAFKHQNHIVSYHAERIELSLLSDMNLPNLDESRLIEIQMSLKNTLNMIKHIQEQFSLLEILKIRLLQKKSFSKKISKKKTQDLILNEIALISDKNKNVFLSQKLHLMFQSFFFTHISEHKSALRVFNRLNFLFEQNEHLWNFPPYDYLSVLDETLNTMGTMGYYKEMEFYIDKLQNALNKNYPGHFIKEIEISIKLHSLRHSIGLKKFENALNIISTIQKNESLYLHSKKESELILWKISFYAHLQDWKSVRKSAATFLIQNINKDFVRIAKIFFIISSYELHDMSTIDYEIRSYRRNYRSAPALYEIEKSIFSIISKNIKVRGNAYKARLQREIIYRIDTDNQKDSEGHKKLLKFYDLKSWLLKKLTD